MDMCLLLIVSLGTACGCVSHYIIFLIYVSILVFSTLLFSVRERFLYENFSLIHTDSCIYSFWRGVEGCLVLSAFILFNRVYIIVSPKRLDRTTLVERRLMNKIWCHFELTQYRNIDPQLEE